MPRDAVSRTAHVETVGKSGLRALWKPPYITAPWYQLGPAIRLPIGVSHSDGRTQRNIFEILLNQTEIRLYLPFSDLFGTKKTSAWFRINRKMLNTIWFRYDLVRFRKDFSGCGSFIIGDFCHANPGNFWAFLRVFFRRFYFLTFFCLLRSIILS